MKWLPVIGCVLLAAALGAFVLVRDGRPTPLLAIALIVPLVVYVVWTRGERRRARLVREPMPAAWRDVLEREVAFYRDLPPPERTRFEGEVHAFIAEHAITGPRGATLDDELKILVAASAVILIFGRPGMRYPIRRDVVVYEDAFDEDSYEVGQHGEILGMVHAQGPILFSARSLREAFRRPHDGKHVGLHEFAHVLDFATGEADGVPELMPRPAIEPWVAAMHAETAKIEANRSILARYAATDEAEFFAVATEFFFERPRRLRDKHPELYGLLAQTYGQDPARDHPETAEAAAARAVDC